MEQLLLSLGWPAAATLTVVMWYELQRLRHDLRRLEDKIDWLVKALGEQGERIARLEARQNGQSVRRPV